MDTNEFKQVLSQAQLLGFETFGDLADLKQKLGCKNNRDFINSINALFCKYGDQIVISLAEAA